MGRTNDAKENWAEFNFRPVKSKTNGQLQIIMSSMLLFTVKRYLSFFFLKILFHVCASIAAGDNSHAAYRLEVFDRMVHAFCS